MTARVFAYYIDNGVWLALYSYAEADWRSRQDPASVVWCEDSLR